MKKIVFTILMVYMIFIICAKVSLATESNNLIQPRTIDQPVATTVNEENQNTSVSEEIEVTSVPVITLETNGAAPGQEFEVPVYIESESGVCAAEITIAYDSGIEFIESYSGDIIAKVEVNSETKKIGISLANEKDIKEKKCITKLKFKIQESASTEEIYDIWIENVSQISSVSNGEIPTYKSIDIAMALTNSTVQVTENIETNVKKSNSMYKKYIILGAGIVLIVILLVMIIIKRRKSK